LKENIESERMPNTILSTCFISGSIMGKPTICNGIKMKNKSTVAIVKIMNGDIKSGFKRIIELLDGINSLVLPYQEVLIKPNWATDKDYTTGTVTHPELIKECVKQVLKCGAAKVYVGDSSFVGKNTEDVILQSGLREIESARVKIIDFKKSTYVPVAVPNAHRYRRLNVPREVMECHTIINIPVMKTHDCMPVTLGLKNMKGILQDKDKRKFHSWGLEEGVIDVNRVALADLTIIDGIIGMEGDGPLNGTPVNANLLIASFDPLAAEVVAIKAMGFEPEEMEYIQMAYEAGFGQKDFSKINIVGEELEKVKLKFKSCYYNGKNFEDNKIVIKDQCACSSCRFILNTYVRDEIESLKEKDVKITFYAGELKKSLCQTEGETVGIGNCLYTEKEGFSSYIPGCPPQIRAVKAAVEKLTNKEN
jgi:uncharacterized protein (DUF362 family)